MFIGSVYKITHVKYHNAIHSLMPIHIVIAWMSVQGHLWSYGQDKKIDEM